MLPRLQQQLLRTRCLTKHVAVHLNCLQYSLLHAELAHRLNHWQGTHLGPQLGLTLWVPQGEEGCRLCRPACCRPHQLRLLAKELLRLRLLLSHLLQVSPTHSLLLLLVAHENLRFQA